jgi:5'-nucleotidase (lipoprotein e(P4) family)
MKRATPVLLVLFTTACATSAPRPASPEPVAAPAAAALPDALHWSRNSAEHRAAFLQTYTLATRRLEELAGGLAPGTWAAALDGDETVIDNSLFEKEQVAKGVTKFDAEAWRAWVERKEAAPLPGAVVFLKRVHELGGKIAIVTNRAQAECPPTEENFRRHGIPYDVILCRPPDNGEKEPRWQALEQGTAAPGLPPLEIVLWVGDNIQDFPDLDQSLRLKPDEAFKEFGTRYFVLPNPMYGSWERNSPE